MISHDTVVVLFAREDRLKLAALEMRADRPYWQATVDLLVGRVEAHGLPLTLPACIAPRELEEAAWLLVSALQATTSLLAMVHVLPNGQGLQGPRPVDTALLEQLACREALSPLCQGTSLQLLRYAQSVWPECPQWVVFDNQFHQAQPSLWRDYALPLALREEGLHAAGYGGLVCERVVYELRQAEPELAEARLIVVQVDEHASVTAIAGGLSVCSSSGFGDLDGLPTATRSGHIDPAILLHLLAQGWSRSRLVDLLYHQSGLQTWAGNSAGWCDWLHSKEPGAQLAVAQFSQRVAEQVVAKACAMQGVDALIFTGDIAVESAHLRAHILKRLAWLGWSYDAERNQTCTASENIVRLNTDTASPAVLVMPADEVAEAGRQFSACFSAASLAPCAVSAL